MDSKEESTWEVLARSTCNCGPEQLLQRVGEILRLSSTDQSIRARVGELMDVGWVERKRRPPSIIYIISENTCQGCSFIVLWFVFVSSIRLSHEGKCHDDLLTRVSSYINGAQTFQPQYPFLLLKLVEDPKELLFMLVRSRDPSFFTGGHLAMSRDISSCHNLWVGGKEKRYGI